MFFKKAQQIAKTEEKPMYSPVIASNGVQTAKDEPKLETIEVYEEPKLDVPKPTQEPQETPQEIEVLNEPELSEEDKEIEALEKRKLQIMEEKAKRLQEEAARMKAEENQEPQEVKEETEDMPSEDLVIGAIKEIDQRLQRIESSLFRAGLR